MADYLADYLYFFVVSGTKVFGGRVNKYHVFSERSDVNKVILEFTVVSREDEDNVIRAIRSLSYESALVRVRNEIFRPARKHGYPLGPLSELYEDGAHGKYELMEALEKAFNDILHEEGIQDV